MWKEPRARPELWGMMALLGSDALFERGREQFSLPAGLEVTAKRCGTSGGDDWRRHRRALRRSYESTVLCIGV